MKSDRNVCSKTKTAARYVRMKGLSLARSRTTCRCGLYHTDVDLLHAAAWKDFTGHLRYLEALNRTGEALELWRSVVEVQHLPATLAIKDPEQYPRMRRSVCTVPGCLACQRGWGGYKFPWLGLWCQEAVVLKPNESITKAWSRWRLPRTRSWMLWEWQKDVCHLWESTHGNGMLCDFHTLHALQSGLRARDLCPDAWHRVVVAASQVSLAVRHMKTCFVRGVAGNLDLRRGWIPHWMACQLERWQ